MRIIKAVSLILLIAVLSGAVSSCGNTSEAPSGMKQVTSEFISYKLYVPESWIVDSSNGFASASTTDKSNISVQVMTGVGNYKSIDDYFQTGYFPKVTSTLQNATLLESHTENQMFGNAQACKYVYSVVSDGATYKIMQIFAANSGYLYIFTYTAADSVFDEHLDSVTQIIDNFSF